MGARAGNAASVNAAGRECGGHLTAERGLLSTPNFPRPFDVPLSCRWVVDSSSQPSPVVIVVYLTQLFVSTGLTFTEYAYYEADSPSFQLEPRILHTVTEENVASLAVVSTNRSFLVVDLTMDRLEGNHLRAADGLLDVFGINVTYNMHSAVGRLPDYSCTAAKCSMLGNCFASADYSHFWCDCFAGYGGPQCSKGPLCQPDSDMCENNSTCRHIGANDVVCECPPGFTGHHCTKLMSDIDCTDELKCMKQCRYDGTRENHCSCDRNGVTVPQDTSRFECTLRLVNTSSTGETVRPLEQRVLKQITKYLKGANLMKYEDAKILNITSTGEVLFHFVGAKEDGQRVRELLMALVEKAKLANFTLNPSHFSFKQQPTLQLLSVSVNRKDGRVGLGGDFSMKCVAKGSTSTNFRWYKDGVPINGTFAIRNVTTWVGPQDSSDKLVSVLMIQDAQRLDEGEYTCQVVDWGVQQCKSVHLSVIQPLNVVVAPMSSTVQKGSNLTLRCYTAMNNKPGRGKLGYNWTRNKALFPMVPGKEFWEDLYPDGSILKLRDIQKGGVFTCQAVDGVWSGEASARVDVLDRLLAGSRCPGEGPWSPSSPGLQASAHCPRGYIGTATRTCLLIEPGKGRWQVPDYSKCFSHHTALITNNFIRLTLGFEGTTVRDTVFEVASWLGGRTRVHPGEAEPLVHLLGRVLAYLNTTGDYPALVNTTPNFFTAVSSLLLRNSSIINQMTIAELLKVVRHWTMSWAKHSGGTFNHVGEGGVVVNTYKINPMQKYVSFSVPRPGFSYPDWMKTRLSVQVENRGRQNDSVIAIVLYRDLGQFFPKHYSQKTSDGKDLEFSVLSPVISIWNTGGLSLETSLLLPEGSLCGRTAFGQDWDLNHCNASGIQNSDTVCLCPYHGVFAALDPQNQLPFKRAELKWRPSLSVLVGCSCCLIQVTLTLCLLALRWWHHSSCLLFLKLQFSTSVAATMVIFIYTSKERAPQIAYLYLSLGLQFFLLIAISTQLAKLVIVYAEVLKIPSGRYLKQTVIVILTGLCGVCGLSCIVISDYAPEKSWWWLRPGTLVFYITTSYAGVLLALYLLIAFDLVFKLRPIVRLKDPKASKSGVFRRVGLVKRSAAVLSVTLIMAASSVAYANDPSPINQSVFSIACGAIGFTIFTCYVVMSENSPRNVKFIKRLHLLGSEEIYSSTSDNSFFTKQEAEAECQAAPPDVTPKTPASEELVLLKPISSSSSSTKTPVTPRKSVSFHSDLVTGCAVIEDAGDSPESLKSSHIVRASYYQNPQTDPAQGCLQEIRTSSGCLDLCSTQTRGTSPPAVMVCNVDVEPGTICLSDIVDDDGKPSDVLNRISHDLDYLLNASDKDLVNESQTSL
ncbi:Hypothetical protein NTJ_08575 [Nesidiocoris tenuis]|nr:Hypothetical protein NTJ_08575 [Nesidiocoris tenuis]